MHSEAYRHTKQTLPVRRLNVMGEPFQRQTCLWRVLLHRRMRCAEQTATPAYRTASYGVYPSCKGCSVCSKDNGCMNCQPKLFLFLRRERMRQYGECLHACPSGYYGVRAPEINIPALPSPAQPSPAQPSPAQPSPAQPSPAQPSPAQPCPAQPSPAQPSPAQPSPAQPRPAQPHLASPPLLFPWPL
ncbi:hypothetical protein ACEWY4_020147 [Coilia grayii]|uniref:R-spondin Fu-CRD domain-containing protein n=1 Tax=Coilia grayii TaxID=363190 RepID=A0ABD1JC34_9TELE